MSVEGPSWVLKVLSECGGPEMGIEGFGWVYNYGLGVGVKGFGWTWKAGDGSGGL